MRTATRRIRRGALAAFAVTALAALAAATALLPAASTDAAAARADERSAKRFLVVGLTDRQRLVAFYSDEARRVQKLGRVRGLVGDGSLVGIDCRVKDGKLYGVGDQGGVYRIRLRDARATKVSQLTVPLQGTSFDVDWNPAANLLRIVSDTGQNLRHNLDNTAAPIPVGQTVADGTLSIPPDVPVATGVTGAAYTNNDNDPDTATTLLVLDTSRDQVAIQSPANAGLLAPTGFLGVKPKGDAGFDIHYASQRKGAKGYGLAALQVNASRKLYRINLLSGQATRIGAFPANRQVTDLAAGFRKDELEGILGCPADC
jgi:Domain of unknown function (DUF4394)